MKVKHQLLASVIAAGFAFQVQFGGHPGAAGIGLVDSGIYATEQKCEIGKYQYNVEVAQLCNEERADPERTGALSAVCYIQNESDCLPAKDLGQLGQFQSAQ